MKAIKSRVTLRADENVYQGSGGEWYAEVLDYPNDPDARWIRIGGGSYNSERAALVTIMCARTDD